MNEYGSATLKYTVVFIYNNINNNNNLTYPSVYLLCAFGFQWESLTPLCEVIYHHTDVLVAFFRWCELSH